AIVGIKSTALRLGEQSRHWIAGFYTAMMALLALAGWMAGLGFWFWPGLLVVGAHLAWQAWFWIPDLPADCLAKFRASRWTGWLILLALWLG
ncbi:MAG: 4-hydroxybenzoate octaprenyltransferase, partial [Pseudomonadota bacterium]|nr:4-hydroxybenzoate octaprenyltransferase [Pseudomonadota bacterium]